jgi:hypothetical protein
MMEKIEKIMEYSSDPEVQKLNIDKLLNEAKFDMDFKYFCLINGMFNKNIYQTMKARSVLLKKVYFVINISILKQKVIKKKKPCIIC